MSWRLLVVDGADAERFFPLPETGSVIIGTSRKHADICLNDLYVSRVHCQVEIEDDRVMVTAMAEDRDTLVNGNKVRQSEIFPGQVLRVGNSHLRLEPIGGTISDSDIVEADDVVEPDSVVDAEEVLAVDAEELPELEWYELDQLANRQLGHFQLSDVLGRGHHGIVFRALDSDARREVALKVISPDFPQHADELKRFAQAMKIVSTIEEEHLVRWYSAGKTKRYVWISEELIEGESLAQILNRTETASKVRWRNALKLALDIGKALECLFKRRIIHGSITPANILIRHVDRTAKLNDLMFEQALKGSAWHSAQLEEKLLATLPYLPPERIEPGAYWDNIADIYSLGAVTYARLTGGPPFLGQTPGETLELIRAGNAPPPRQFFKDVPEQFQAAVLKMLAPRQEDRYQTPAEVLKDLEACQILP